MNSIEWKKVELGQVVKLQSGYAFKTKDFKESGIPIVRISNFNNSKIDLSNSVYYSKDFDIEKNKNYFLEENDILIAMSGATTGKLGFVRKENLPCLLNQRIGKFKILDSRRLNNNYLKFYLFSKSFQKLVIDKAFGCAQPNISNKDIESLKIPLPYTNGEPDLEIQQQIVEKLELAEQLKENRTKADELTKQYLNSVFLEMFGDPRTNPKGFEMKKIEDVCETSSGGTPSRTKKEYWDNGTIPWIKSGELDKGYIYKTSESITELAVQMSSAKLVEPETVLIAMYGATVGKTAITKIRATTNQAICSLNSKNTNLTNIYLYWILKFLKEDLIKKSFGGGQPNISQQLIKTLQIPLPPLELQTQFANIVEEVEQLKEYQKKSGEEIENLYNKLLQDAFSGRV